MDNAAKIDQPKSAPSHRLRICLAGSGGGHVRQLLDLERAWSGHPHFFVSEDTALSRSIAEEHRTHFVPHVALGQARLGAPVRMLVAALRSFFKSAWIILRERSDVLISTGVGAVFFCVLWVRMLGAKIVLVESFARFDRPSLFGRMAAPFAHRKVVQSKALSSYWPDAAVFDPLRILDTTRPQKKAMVFVTVGAILTFDRLVQMVADLHARDEIPESILVQTGLGGITPAGIDTVETLSFDQMQACLRHADIVICHGGTGSIITALRQGCRVIAVPRLFERGEVYDNHQAEITTAFAERGLIVVANSSEELAEALTTVRSRPPVSATTDSSRLVDYLNEALSEWSKR